MAERFTDEEIEAFKSAFSLLDREENGLIPFKKIGFLLRSVGENPTDLKINEIINDLLDANDLAHGRYIDFTDFLLIMSKIRHEDEEKEIEDAFSVFDKDGSGTVKKDEIRVVLEFLKDDVDQEDIAEMLNDFDMDEDGIISYEEFAAVMGFNKRTASSRDSSSETGSGTHEAGSSN